MKHVCRCRVCGCEPSIRDGQVLRYTTMRYAYWYECQCGMLGEAAIKKSWARLRWNEDNTAAESMAKLATQLNRIEVQLDRIGRHMFADWDKGWDKHS